MSFGNSKEEISNNVCLNDDGVPRRFVDFQPSVWGDYFLSYDSTTLEEDDLVRKEVAGLKEEVRNMFETTEKCSEKLRLIDLIQRLGLCYHFEGEINEIVDHIHNNIDLDDHEDLYIMALRFRLLRQQGYFVSCEIFNKFTNGMGGFKESIVKDERGLLSLFEASHLGMNGEKIMDEALAFTTTHLQEIAILHSSSPFGEEVKYALRWPMYKAVPRLMSKHHISLYNNIDPLHNNVLLTFAKLDYNLLQKLYQKEVGELTRWMKELKMMEKLCYTRDRTVESYAWSLGVFYEPKYSRARILLAKIITFISALDDTYDVYATLDELQSFTNAIQRWDINEIEKLPDYMKFLYEAIYDIYKEAEQDICNEYNIPLALDYAKDKMKGLCKAYFKEAKWFHEGYVPNMEEYMKVGIVSSSYYVFASFLFLDLGTVASKEVLQWVDKSDPMLIKATGVIGRLMNDITSHKFEQERGHVASAVECYMKQFEEEEERVVVELLEKQVVKAWKDLTQDYIKSKDINIPNAFLMRILNLARVSNLFYKNQDGYTFVDGDTKSFITNMIVHPI